MLYSTEPTKELPPLHLVLVGSVVYNTKFNTKGQTMINQFMDSVSDTAKELLPGVEKLTKRRKKMIDSLLMAGYKKKDIVDFLYLTSSDVKEYIDIRKEAAKLARTAEANK